MGFADRDAQAGGAAASLADKENPDTMPATQPFVVHETDCELERWGDSADSQLSWRTLISADRSPTDSLTLGVAEIQPDDARTLRLHRHEQAEVYYILSGEGIVTIDGIEHRVRAGSAVFVPGNALHGSLNSGSEPLRILYVFPAASFDQVHYDFPAT